MSSSANNGQKNLNASGSIRSIETLYQTPSQYVRDYERLFMSGVWAQVDMRFESDEESKGKNPFWIDKLTPIQIANFDLDEYRNVWKEFSTNEWIDLMIRSMGFEPRDMTRRLNLLFLVRLIPLEERNYNLIELGPC